MTLKLSGSLTGGWRLTNLKAIRKQNHKTQEQVARDLDIPVGTYRNWEQQKNNPNRENLQNLATYFNCTINDFVIAGSEPGNPKWILVPVPLYCKERITCETIIDPSNPDYWPDEEWPIPAEIMSRYSSVFLYTVTDNGISRVLPLGSYALIDTNYEANDSGSICLVCIGDNEAVFRRVKTLANGVELIPDSLDPTYRSQVFDQGVEGTDSITIIGRVVWYTIPYDFEI